MPEIQNITARARSTKFIKGGNFDVTKMNSMLTEMVADINDLVSFHNTVLVPLIQELPLGSSDDEVPTQIAGTIDAPLLGLSGDQIWTDNASSLAQANQLPSSAFTYLFFEGTRRATIKETFIKLAQTVENNFTSLQSLINSSLGLSDYTKAYIGLKAFDASLVSSGSSIDGRLVSLTTSVNALASNTYNGSYSSSTNLTYSLAQIIDALLDLHGGSAYKTGLTYSSTVSLSHSIPVSSLTYDALIAQTNVDKSSSYATLNRAASVNNLEDDLNRIRFEIATLRGGNWNDDFGVAPAYDTSLVSLAGHIADLGSGAALATNPHGLAARDISDIYSDFGAISIIADGTSIAVALQALDAAIGGGNDLQGSYDASIAGTIDLNPAIGPLFIRDNATPLGTTLFAITDSASLPFFAFTASELLLAGTHVSLQKVVSDPGASANIGKLYSKDDAGDTELFYRDNTGNIAQLSRDGIVKELEIGRETILPNDMTKLAAAAGPLPAVIEYGGGSSIALNVSAFDPSTVENGYTTVPVPVDENGNTPSRFKIILYTLSDSYVGGSGWHFDVLTSNSIGIQPVGHGTLINPGWSLVGGLSQTGLTAGDIDKVYILDFGIQTLAVSVSGLLNLKITRDVTHLDDNWDSDVGILRAQVIWYR